MEPNDELLPRADPEGLPVAAESSLGLCDEARSLFLDPAPRRIPDVREELGEREDAESVDGELGHDALLTSSSSRVAREAAAAGAVREDPVVKGVRGPYPSLLEPRRDVVDPRGEACLRPVHDALRYPT